MSVKIVVYSKNSSSKLPHSFVPFDVVHVAGTVYNIHGISEISLAKKIADEISNPVLHDTVCIAKSGECEGNLDVIRAGSLVIQVSYSPGVTDNPGNVAREMVEMLFGQNVTISTSSLYIINTNLTDHQLEVVKKSVHNPIIHIITVESGHKFADIILPYTWQKHDRHEHKPRFITVDLDVDEEKLVKISKFGIVDGHVARGALGLTRDDMLAVARYCKSRGRNITDVELETIAQTWSEHCKHRIFNAPLDDLKEGIFKAFIKRATDEIMAKKPGFCVSVFTDNAGAISFNAEYMVTHKVETHNSPSAIEPFGGSITGILGVNRDCLGFGLGAKPIANTYGFCFAEPDDKKIYRDGMLKTPALDPIKIINEVVLGVEAGGNCSGIPTPHGIMYYDQSYRGKPLVYVGTVGIMPKKINGRLSHVKQVNDGDLIVILGGGVGRDGIHGATLSSDKSDEQNNATMVQLGDPYMQKKLTMAILEMRDQNIFNAITDNGAGGLSSSIGEMGRGGFIVELDKVHLKSTYIDPWEIWISESQERMTLAVAPDKLGEIAKIAEMHEVPLCVIGLFNRTGVGIVTYNDVQVMDIDLDFLHNGYVTQHLRSTKPNIVDYSTVPSHGNIAAEILQLLGTPNICSKAMICRRYDHEVQGSAVLRPIIGGVCTDASIIRPILDSSEGVAISSSMLPGYSDPSFAGVGYFDTYNMAGCVIDTAIRNLVVVGANPDRIAILDNFCWRDSHNPHSLWQLKRAAQSCYDHASVYGTPFISGKDSMFNDFAGFDGQGNSINISATPTLLISSIAVMDDIKCAISMDFKRAGDIIYVVGDTFEEMGGSEYCRMKRICNSKVPSVKPDEALSRYRKFFLAVGSRLIASAVSIGIGGFAAAITKSSLSGSSGCEVDISGIGNTNMMTTLFSESQSRLIMTVRPENEGEILDIFGKGALHRIGVVARGDVVIRHHSDEIRLTLEEISNHYNKNSLHVV